MARQQLGATPSRSNDAAQQGAVDAKATLAQVTQAQYDALVTKDPATLYVVVG